MSFSNGDKVRIGKGKVEWTVTSTSGQGGYFVNVVSAKGQKRECAFSELTLVQAATPPVKFSTKPAKLVKGKRGGQLRTVR